MAYDNMYGGTPPHQSHSRTSKAAAEHASTEALTIRGKVLDFIRSRGPYGATHEEISKHIGKPVQTAVPRRRELFLQGYVVDSGRLRRNPSGRDAIVWVATKGPVTPLPSIHTAVSELKKARKRIEELEAEVQELRHLLGSTKG